MRNKSVAKHELWLKWLSTLLLPLTLVFLGHEFSQAQNERSVQAKFVELALDILKEQPTDDRKQLRIWAIKVVDEYAGVRLSPEARASLVAEQSVLSLETINSQVEHDSTQELDDKKSIQEVRRDELIWRCENKKSTMSYWTWVTLCKRFQDQLKSPAK